LYMTKKYGIIRLAKYKIINHSYEFYHVVAIASGTAKKER